MSSFVTSRSEKPKLLSDSISNRRISQNERLPVRHAQLSAAGHKDGPPSTWPAILAIRCTLEMHDLNEDILEYEALSYEWGELTSEGRTIFLNDREIQVRDNLWSALIHLRYSDITRLLWIDALCIDQANTQEHNHQVRIMGDIYCRAKLVLVWLGQEGENSAEVFAHLHQNGILYFESDLGGEIILEGLASLLNRRYWTRIWIVQEFNLGPELEIHCGWDSIDGNIILNIARFLEGTLTKAHERIRASPGMKIAARRSMRQRDSGRLWEFLSSCKDSQCSEPRDKIYALMPMADDMTKDAIQIDYSLTLFELKLLVALHYSVEENSNLKFILWLCGLLDQMLGGEEQSPAIEPIIRTRNNNFAEIRKGFEIQRREKDLRPFISNFGPVIFDFETRISQDDRFVNPDNYEDLTHDYEHSPQHFWESK
jgi:hypothetical protein